MLNNIKISILYVLGICYFCDIVKLKIIYIWQQNLQVCLLVIY